MIISGDCTFYLHTVVESHVYSWLITYRIVTPNAVHSVANLLRRCCYPLTWLHADLKLHEIVQERPKIARPRPNVAQNQHRLSNVGASRERRVVRSVRRCSVCGTKDGVALPRPAIGGVPYALAEEELVRGGSGPDK